MWVELLSFYLSFLTLLAWHIYRTQSQTMCECARVLLERCHRKCHSWGTITKVMKKHCMLWITPGPPITMLYGILRLWACSFQGAHPHPSEPDRLTAMAMRLQLPVSVRLRRRKRRFLLLAPSVSLKTWESGSPCVLPLMISPVTEISHWFLEQCPNHKVQLPTEILRAK